MHPLQEKFQITVPAKAETATDESWIFGVPRCPPPEGEGTFPPPGMNIDNNTHGAPSMGMPYSVAGRSDVSDKLASPESMLKGFTKLEMKGSDDQYTGEHVDHFYGDAGGFVERNNYLDRE